VKRPRTVYLDPAVLTVLDNPDALSISAIAFRNGGNVGGKEALPFVELTDDLLALLRAQTWDKTDQKAVKP
jgi:hypothetical protein